MTLRQLQAYAYNVGTLLKNHGSLLEQFVVREFLADGGDRIGDG